LLCGFSVPVKGLTLPNIGLLFIGFAEWHCYCATVYSLLILVSWAPTTVLKLMGSYLVFVVTGFILVLFCLEAQSASSTQSSVPASSSASATTESNVDKLQLKVINEICRLTVGLLHTTLRSAGICLYTR